MDKTLNINLNVNININVNNRPINWALCCEDKILLELFDEIANDKIKKEKSIKKTIVYCTNLIDNINVDFEPDPSYRDNVKYMITGLVLCQILKQKTINLFRKGKEDREYLASFLMMKIQSYIISNHELDDWDDIILGIYEYYKDKIIINDDMKRLLENGINKIKLITQDILVSTVLSNKKNYTIRRQIDPYDY